MMGMTYGRLKAWNIRMSFKAHGTIFLIVSAKALQSQRATFAVEKFIIVAFEDDSQRNMLQYQSSRPVEYNFSYLSHSSDPPENNFLLKRS